MELHKRRGGLVLGLILFVVGAFVLLCLPVDGPIRILLWVGGALVLGVLIVRTVRPSEAAGRLAPQVGVDNVADPDFTVVLRGYDPAAVDELVRVSRDALSLSPGDQRRVTTAGRIQDTRFPIALRGYDRWQVDAFLDGLAAELAAPAGDPDASGTGS
ncbi:DivIVA domain-containing protein [Micromonospora sp. NBC_01813]|uniref:DivIVA domain-containing protein n=1 Tax=Micromonospora sp. NBC_01813 TaxID=2975988 RepID=UPI002DDA1A57|nr:DivIVA domain-containing protein [Micromonospora sp. NBC_01813]WSA08995.1 DivIVA domain-containing protein [Micromonospora sp. NBC_01813]